MGHKTCRATLHVVDGTSDATSARQPLVPDYVLGVLQKETVRIW